MFAAAHTLPYYTGNGFSIRPKTSGAYKKKIQGNASSASRPSTKAGEGEGEGGEILAPAIDGPPSPEKIRALNKQAQRASSAVTSSSQTTSARASATDNPSWEQTLEHVALSRRSSARSTSSSMPSRERPESVQLFGKTIFSRRSRARRESSANSSSGSSLYSAETPAEALPPPAKDQYMSGLFGRKKAMSKLDMATGARVRSNSASSKRFQISGPYNFQHVTHTPREHLPRAPATSHGEGVSGQTGLHGSEETATSTSEIKNSDHDGEESRDDIEGSPPISPISPYRQHQPPISPSLRRSQPHDLSPQRLLKHTRSSDQIRSHALRSVAPQRPPRSPTEQLPTSPIVPPRLSSRASTRSDGYETTGSTPSERTLSGGGFRQPRPFALPEETLEEGTGDQVPELAPAAAFSHALTTPGDAAWPLPSTSATFTYEAALPDVPEEDEHFAAARRSRLSIASNSSSLRGSQSVPMLRLSGQVQAGGRQRPPSGASDTLGRFDMFAAQRALKADLGETVDDIPDRESWEEDIDYCYEHEAEADCNFAWDRRSLEFVCDGTTGDCVYAESETAAQSAASLQDVDEYDSEKHVTGLMPVPARHYDLPIMGSVSPGASSTSTPVTSNFSHPRTYTSRRKTKELHVRTGSHASSFKESHGFTLSPSLLIPGDFQQQMIMANSQGMSNYVDDAASPSYNDAIFADASPMALETSGAFNSERASTSTVDTASSVQTGSSGERHFSADSNFSAPTRYTGSTTFEGWDPKVLESSEPVPAVHLEGLTGFPSPSSLSGPRSPLSDAGDGMFPLAGDIQSGDVSPQSPKIKETMARHRRQRANTASSSASGAGYGLFPPAYANNRA